MCEEVKHVDFKAVEVGECVEVRNVVVDSLTNRHEFSKVF